MSAPTLQSLVHRARRSVVLGALLAGLCAAVALHHGGMGDMDVDMGMHDAPMLVICLSLAATASSGWAAPPPDRSWGIPVDRRAPSLAVPTVAVPSPARDGPALLQVFRD